MKNYCTHVYSNISKLDVISFLGAIPVSIAFQMGGAFWGWLMYATAFYAFVDAKPSLCVRRGIICGFNAGVINFCWILGGGSRFTGQGVMLSLAIILALSCVIAIYVGVIAWLYGSLKWKAGLEIGSVKNLVNAILLASIFTLFDSLMLNCAKSFALMLYVSFIPIASDLIAIQPASVFGPLIITFAVVFLNAQLAHIFYYRVWKLSYLPILTMIIYYSLGIELYRSYRAPNVNEVKTAVLAENLTPEFKWDDRNGNALVERLFKLTRKALDQRARLIVWSETAIPWNFTPEDHFLRQIASISAPDSATHLIGMNTDHQGRTFYNSIYCLSPGFQISGRYDKNIALSLIEKPFLGLVLPFYNNNGFLVKEGESNMPLSTPVGKAGILICNESTIPSSAYKHVQQQAQFLVNPGNDGWFSDTYIAKQHFFHARLRAVETRKDIIVNSNSGYSGLIEASGKIQRMAKAPTDGIIMVNVRPNTQKTLAVSMPYLMELLAAMCIAVFLMLKAVDQPQTKH